MQEKAVSNSLLGNFKESIHRTGRLAYNDPSLKLRVGVQVYLWRNVAVSNKGKLRVAEVDLGDIFFPHEQHLIFRKSNYVAVEAMNDRSIRAQCRKKDSG